MESSLADRECPRQPTAAFAKEDFPYPSFRSRQGLVFPLTSPKPDRQGGRNGFLHRIFQTGRTLLRPILTAPIAKSRSLSNGGARRDRTDDLMLAKHALSQLSYGPESISQRTWPMRTSRLGAESAARPTRRRASWRESQADGRPRRRLRPTSLVGLGGLEPPTSRLSSARSNQLSYKPGSARTRSETVGPIPAIARNEHGPLHGVLV